MKESLLLSKFHAGHLELKNRVVMAPMTRSRATGNIPNETMATYYEQRSGAGLIITEGTSPSPNGLGYPRIPGIFSPAQVEGWKKVTTAVHRNNGKIFIQLMHTGRISHILNLPAGGRVLAPSAVQAAGQMRTDPDQKHDFPVPEEMTAMEIAHAIKEFADAAHNGIEAGFDGVELHGANGYLPEEFLSPLTNIRQDSYGGSIENRCRFILEVIAAVSNSIGKERTGIRLSPYGIGGDMSAYPEIDQSYKYLAEQLDKAGIAYLHIVDHSTMRGPKVPIEIKKTIRNVFHNLIILSGGYDQLRAETDLESGLGDLVAFGRPFINNPDLVERFKNNQALSVNPDFNLFYAGGEKGYTDYPFYKS